MKRKGTLLCAIIMMVALMLNGCGGQRKPTMTMDVSDEKTALITANNSDDGDFLLAGSIIVEDGEEVCIDSALDEGEIIIEFMTIGDESINAKIDDITSGEAVWNDVASGNETMKCSFGEGEFSIKATSKGKANGTVTITIVDAEDESVEPDASAAEEASDGAGDGTAAALEDCGVIHELEFGGVYIKMTIEDFNALGYEYGDSVDVAFSNGYELTDLPYYNGYYTVAGNPLLVAYPGYDYIKACVNSGDDLFEVAELDESMTATVTLNTRGKYLSVQEARDIHYVDEREEFSSDEAFANFRAMEGGSLKKNTIYRSASPCDNVHNRAPYVDTLMSNAGVRFILSLSDSEEKIQGYMSGEDFNSPCYAEIYEAGNVEAIALNMNITEQDFKEKLANGLTAMAEHEGPYLIHCTEGKDRTGFVCMLIEALAGASYDEIVKDYMLSYDNYYGITEESDPEKYSIIVSDVLNSLIQRMVGDESVDITTEPLAEYAEKYLLEGGMTAEAIEQLKAQVTE